MRPLVQRTVLVSGLVALLGGTAGATTFVGVTERTLARTAEAIVVGAIEHIETVGGRDGTVDTLVTVRVEQTLKGDVGTRVTLKQPGGRLPDRVMWIAGSPRFAVGERQLLFLSAHSDGTARTTDFGMGQFVLRPHARTGALLAERSLDALVLGARPIRRVPLSRLLRIIRYATAAEHERLPAPLVTVPDEVVDPGLERVPVAEFTFMDSPPGRWFEPDSGLPVTYQTAGGDATLGDGQSLAALDAALAAWTNVSGASIVLQRGAPTAPAPLRCDGLSQIVFNDPFKEMPKPVACSGVLALGGYCTSTASMELDGRTFFRITEGNITFNQGFASCSFWNVTNLGEVATHELGHTIGIGHSSESDDAPPDLKDATMYYRAHFDGRGASLRADDIAAVRTLYPGPGTADPNVDDVDGDGIVDARDDCPAIPNPAQIDTDGDGIGDVCDPCPLAPGAEGACQPISVSRLVITLAGARSRLVWRGAVNLPAGAHASAARVLLVDGSGVVVDSAMGSALVEARRTGARRPLRYRSGQALITLRPAQGGSYQVRVSVRGVNVPNVSMPLVSASLQVGDVSFADSLSCSAARGRHLVCRG
jgi:matrixin/thrombospondin type 3 repeat protein